MLTAVTRLIAITNLIYLKDNLYYSCRLTWIVDHGLFDL